MITRKLILASTVLVLATAAFALAGCGGDDEPTVCGSLETLSADIDKLTNTDLAAGEGVVAEVEADLDTIRTDLEAVKTDAEAEFSEPIAGLESSLSGLSTEIDSVKTAGTVTAESAQSLADSAAAVSTAWVALKAAAPDCNL